MYFKIRTYTLKDQEFGNFELSPMNIHVRIQKVLSDRVQL